MSPEQAALAVLRTVDENMANAIRLIAVERGLDTRDFALIAFGGAGPLHARAVAERLGMTTVIVPPHPGLCSAFGAAIAEARVDRVQTLFTNSDSLDLAGLAEAIERLRDATSPSCARSVEVADAGDPQLGRHALCRPELRGRGPAAVRRARRAGLGRDADGASPRPMPSSTASTCRASRSS